MNKQCSSESNQSCNARGKRRIGDIDNGAQQSFQPRPYSNASGIAGFAQPSVYPRLRLSPMPEYQHPYLQSDDASQFFPPGPPSEGHFYSNRPYGSHHGDQQSFFTKQEVQAVCESSAPDHRSMKQSAGTHHTTPIEGAETDFAASSTNKRGTLGFIPDGCRVFDPSIDSDAPDIRLPGDKTPTRKFVYEKDMVEVRRNAKKRKESEAKKERDEASRAEIKAEAFAQSIKQEISHPGNELSSIPTYQSYQRPPASHYTQPAGTHVVQLQSAPCCCVPGWCLHE